MNNKKWYVYCHTNKENNKKYVGITKQNPIKRWDSGEGYKTVKHKNGVNTFYEDVQKYGWENFTHEILYSELTVEEANNKEIELIQKYSSLQPNGYNISKGGGAHDNQNRTKNQRLIHVNLKLLKKLIQNQ